MLSQCLHHTTADLISYGMGDIKAELKTGLTDAGTEIGKQIGKEIGHQLTPLELGGIEISQCLYQTTADLISYGCYIMQDSNKVKKSPEKKLGRR